MYRAGIVALALLLLAGLGWLLFRPAPAPDFTFRVLSVERFPKKGLAAVDLEIRGPFGGKGVVGARGRLGPVAWVQVRPPQVLQDAQGLVTAVVLQLRSEPLPAELQGPVTLSVDVGSVSKDPASAWIRSFEVPVALPAAETP